MSESKVIREQLRLRGVLPEGNPALYRASVFASLRLALVSVPVCAVEVPEAGHSCLAVPNQNSIYEAKARVLPMGAVACRHGHFGSRDCCAALVPTSQPGGIGTRSRRPPPSINRVTTPAARPSAAPLADRVLWVWLYRLWPGCLRTMLLVKPATVVQWHRQRFRLYWRWRSRPRRPGRPRLHRESRQLIRQMSTANPLWGAPRIHGEILKLGIQVSQATVARYMVRRPPLRSPTWRSFLRNHMDGIAALDMFVVASASFRLLYVMVVLRHDRRKIEHLAVTQYPTAGCSLAR